MPRLGANVTSITKGQVRYQRLQILRSKIDGVLYERFHQKFSKNPITLAAELRNFQKDIKDLRKKGVIFDDQYNLLLPGPGVGVDSTKFDTTLLMVLLKNFCGYNFPKKKKWTPLQTDRGDEANMTRLLTGRNMTQHLPPDITQVEFDEVYDLVEIPLLDLGLSQADLDEVKTTRIIDDEVQEIIQPKSFNYNCLPPITTFSSRDQELKDLHQALSNQKQNNKLGAVLYGIGGIGKSESVRKYWTLHDQEFEETVCWINATNFATIEACFRDIADKCGIHDARDAKGNYKPHNEVVTLV